MSNIAEVVEKLKDNPNIPNAPEEQLRWLAEHSTCQFFPKGDIIFHAGESTDNMIIMIEGKAEVYLEQNGDKRLLSTISKNDITGLLPYSRLDKAMATGYVKEDAHVMKLHRDHMP